MTYTEWRDELKSNLLCVSENERRRVLDYYAEAYADRREAGFTEREIIADFGAPYDAAQRILYEKVDDGDVYAEPSAEPTRREARRENRERRREQADFDSQARREQQQRAEQPNRGQQGANSQQYYAPPPPPPNYAQPAYAGVPTPTAADRGDYTWVFVLLCVIFCVPLFGLIMTMVGITVGLCVAPIAVIGGGAVTIGAGFGSLFSAGAANGFFTIGVGLIILGAGVALCPVFFKLVGLMWKLFGLVFGWLKSLFSGKEKVK